MALTWYPTSQNRKIWCLTFLKHYQTSLYDFQSQILKVLIFGNFKNFHLWVKIFKNQNRPKSAGKSYPGFILGFFDVKTLLYIKNRKCGHVLVTLHNFMLKKPFFGKPTNDFSPYRFTAWYPKISKFLRLKSMMSQLSNARSNVLLRPLDQMLYHFEVQKYHC